MLLLVAARRRGDRLPGRSWSTGLAHRRDRIGGVFLFGVVSFGLRIWSAARALAALLVGVAMIALTVVSWRRGRSRRAPSSNTGWRPARPTAGS
jgi:hypothetical protein